MKKLLIVFAIALCTLTGSAQKLVDIYKKGTVRLVPDKEYGPGKDFRFENYNDTIYARQMGKRKNIILMPDGSAVVGHVDQAIYTLFSPEGRLVGGLGIKSSKGVAYKKVNQIAGIVNNNTFYTQLDNMGNMVCFDFKGNYVKTLKLNYMTRQMITLPNNRIAVVGWVIWKEKFREFVSIVNYDTNEEKIVWEHFTDRCDPDKQCKLFNYTYTFEKQGMISINTMPYVSTLGMSAPPIIATTGNQLVVVIPDTGEINLFDLNGNKLGKEKVSWANNFISVEEQKEIQRKAIEKYKNFQDPMFASWASNDEKVLALNTVVKNMEQDLEKITDPIPIPAISTVIKDSDGNLLFFEYPKEENANKFHVWVLQNGGEFICQSSFVCDEYDLKINPSKMVFYNGMIYGLPDLKNEKGVPVRLVRFKLE
ncbi:MAG TPA: hypothetical protein VGK10_11535 [Prolixibacteraceae bacterium]|jgi:hypothetical protein